MLEGAANLRPADHGMPVDAHAVADGSAQYGATSVRLDRLPATRAVWS